MKGLSRCSKVSKTNKRRIRARGTRVTKTRSRKTEEGGSKANVTIVVETTLWGIARSGRT